MKKFYPLVVVFLFLFTNVSAQEKCDSPQEVSIDLNSITKCAVEDISSDKHAAKARNKKQVSIQVSTRRRARKSKESFNMDTKEAHKVTNSIIADALELDGVAIPEKLPFNMVEEIPLFEKCEIAPFKEQTSCFNKQMVKHIKKHFKYPSEAYKKNIQGRVLINFVIDNTGNITDINVRGPYQGELLEKEAKRIISKLPKFIPGKQRGRAIKVNYGIPISFKIPGKKRSNVRKKKVTKVDHTKEAVAFSVIEEIPQFANCKSTQGDSLDCFNTEMVKHIQKYFAYPKKAANKGIEGKVTATFVIDKEGDVVNIEAHGPKGAELLEEAAKNVVSRLPAFIPGKHGGKVANVKYSIPITFKLN